MSNAMKYIRNLEAAGFDRNQAEAQVQMVLDALEGDLVTKSEFAVFQERIENRFAQFELRIVTKLGLITVSSVTIAVAILAWLNKT